MFVCLCSSSTLQYHDNYMDLHGPGVRPGHLSGHHHLQETARLHFTTLPIAAVCGTLSYTTIPCLSLCNVACDQHPVCTVFLPAFATYSICCKFNESKVVICVKFFYNIPLNVLEKRGKNLI